MWSQRLPPILRPARPPVRPAPPPRPTNATIRPAEPTDEFACVALDTGYQADHAWQVERREGPDELSVRVRRLRLPRPRQVPPARELEAFAQVWAGAAPILVAELGDEVVGWLAAWPRPDETAAHLAECVVAPAHRRRGIASALLAAWHNQAADEGVRRLRALVPTGNDPAIRWLLRAGWRLCGWEERQPDGVPDLILARWLWAPAADRRAGLNLRAGDTPPPPGLRRSPTCRRASEPAEAGFVVSARGAAGRAQPRAARQARYNGPRARNARATGPPSES